MCHCDQYQPHLVLAWVQLSATTVSTMVQQLPPSWLPAQQPCGREGHARLLLLLLLVLHTSRGGVSSVMLCPE